MTRRHALAAAGALMVTFGLFYLMQALISISGSLDEKPRGSLVEFIRLRRDSQLELKKREMPKKKLPEKPPPMPDLHLNTPRASQDLVGIGVGIGLGVELESAGGLLTGASDADVVPVVRVNPQYPIRAAQRGIEGWVEVQFTISSSGSVIDAAVINSNPPRVFDQAALRAIRKWKYNPKMVDGKPVERPGVKVRLRFQLEEG